MGPVASCISLLLRRYRQQLEADRVELERIHAERLARLAAREEEASEKLRRQQRDVEGIAYSQRQRILAEEDRLRNMKAEVCGCGCII
jgi:oral-facial-digital syndrome 1 protein